MVSNKLDRKFLFWGIESIGEGWIAIVSSTYLAMFMTDIALIPLGLVSGAMLVMSISDFIFATTSGAVISMIRPKRWGRLRSYLLICPPITAIFYIIHFISIPKNTVLTTLIITVGFIVAKLLYNLVYTANVSLITIIARDQKAKNRLSSQRMIGSNAGRMLGNYLTPVIVLAASASVSERALYPLIMVGVGVVYILTNLIHFALSKGYETAGETIQVKRDGDTLSLKTIISLLSKNHQLLVTLIIDLSSNVAALVLPSLSVYYYKYVAQRPDLTSVHMLLIGLASVAGSLLVRVLDSKVKNPRKALLYIYPIISICLFSTRFFSHNIYIFMALNVLVHGLTGTTQPFELSLYMNQVIYTKYKTGQNANALIMGLSGVTVKIANIVKSGLIPFALMTSGYVAGTVTPEVKASIIKAYSTIPAIMPLIGFILLKFFYKLTKEKMDEISAKVVLN